MLGKPVIAYAIEAALESALFAQVAVSTDHPQIAEVAVRFGADVPFMRNPELADDRTHVSAVTVDMLERLDPEGTLFDSVAQLMPNCPLRTADDIRDSYTQFATTGSSSQISVMRYGWQNPWWAMRRSEDFELVPLFEREATRRSQDLPELFCPTGVIWWGRADVLRQEGTFHVAGRTGWEIPWQRGVDIDTEDDWQMAEFMMKLARASQSGQA